MENYNNIISDLIKYFKIPDTLFVFGIVLNVLFKLSIHINEYIALGFAFFTLLALGTGVITIIYMTVILISDTSKHQV